MTDASFSQFAKRHRLQCLPTPRETWRLLQQPVVGEVTGLGHKFRGLAVATNGIIVCIETSAGNILFGHLQWFEKDNQDEPSDLDNKLPTRKKPQALAEFADCF